MRSKRLEAENAQLKERLETAETWPELVARIMINKSEGEK